MGKLVVLILGVFILAACQHPKDFKAEKEANNKEAVISVMDQLESNYCPTTKEFITVYEYLKSKKGYFKPKWAMDTANDVATGCKGAAMRFIKVFELLLRAETYADDAAKLGVMAANSTDEVTESFIETFQKAYLKNYLDLDLGSSIKLARGLSFTYKGKVKNAQDDFTKLVRFCSAKNSLNLSKPVCAKLAYRVSLLGQDTPGGIYDAFYTGFDYLTSGRGPKVTVETALRVSEELVSVSPMAVYNFVKAYEYGMNKEGMGLTVTQAVKFARNLGKTSVRLPASIEEPTKTESSTVPQK